MTQRLYEYLCKHDDAAWARAIDLLASSFSDVDRNATRIWFAFYPLKLAVALEGAESAADRIAVSRKLGLMGHWGLLDSVDSSHRFLFGHRYWPAVKAAIQATTVFPQELAALVTQIAEAARETSPGEAAQRGAQQVARDQLAGITAVGLMTLRQVGPEIFEAAPGRVDPAAIRAKSPEAVLKTRAKDDSQGVFGFLRGIRKQWTVTFDEHEPTSRFTAIQMQDLATAAQSDKREYRSKDARCIPNEGPIPVECRAASCGTCWVGVIGGAEKLTPVEPHEAVRMKIFGYAENAVGTRPIIRLACQAKAEGAVSIVIPPWNGFIARL